MRTCEHPAYQRTERKLHRFAGGLTTFAELLREDGFDRDEAGRWWYGEYQKLKALEEAAQKDPTRLPEWQAEEQRVEAELFQRMDRLIKFIYARAPEHPHLPPYRLYLALWHQCYGEPIRPLSQEDLTPPQELEELVIAPTIYGVPYDRLDAARLRLGEMDLPHKGFAPLVMFFCGLSHAAAYHDRHQKPPEHPFNDGLREAAREALAEAVDFGNEPGTVAQAKRQNSEPLSEPLSRLFMAIYYVQRNHTPAVYEWLCRHSFTRDLTSLLFAMGVRALTDLYAQRLVAEWLASPDLVWALLPEECRALIASLREEE
jgi:hypothetical protein